MNEFIENNLELLIGVSFTVIGWFLGIVTRPLVDKFFIDRPRVHISTRFRADQAVHVAPGTVFMTLHVMNEIQNHSIQDVFGFEITRIDFTQSEDCKIHYERMKSPVHIDRSKPFNYNYSLKVRLYNVSGDYQYFDYSIPALRKQLPLFQTIYYSYKNAHGRVFLKKRKVTISPSDDIEEGFWAHGF